MRFLGVPLIHSRSASLTSNIVTSRYIHGLLLRPLRGPKQEACTRGQAGGKGFEKLQSRGGKGFEKLSRKGSLGFENRHKFTRKTHRHGFLTTIRIVGSLVRQR